MHLIYIRPCNYLMFQAQYAQVPTCPGMQYARACNAQVSDMPTYLICPGTTRAEALHTSKNTQYLDMSGYGA